MGRCRYTKQIQCDQPAPPPRFGIRGRDHDLAMKAVSDGAGSTIEAASEAIKAGADMLLIDRLGDEDQTADVGAQVNRSITSKVCAGEIDIDAIRRSKGRILKLRRRLPSLPVRYPKTQGRSRASDRLRSRELPNSRESPGEE